MSVRYRRNIDCLTGDQLHDLREALAAIYTLQEEDGQSFATIAGLHGSPSPTYCIHGSPGFLTWHRAYLLELEKALQCVRPKVMLPFWDWSSGPSTGVPAACRDSTYVNRNGNTVANPLYSGPIAAAAGGGQTSRRADIDTTAFDDLATTAQAAMGSATFSSFQSALNGVHGSVHIRTGGNMADAAKAGFDPIFYLHHANVDRLWAVWQKSHPAPLPSNEAGLSLDPFSKPYSDTWRSGAEFESTEDWGYRYSNFCLWIPPIIIWEVMELDPLPPLLVERLVSARLVLRSERMQSQSAEVRVFVNQPRANSRTRTVDNPHFAGSVGFFGMGEKLEMRGREENFDLEMDITETVRRHAEESQALSLRLVAVGADGKQVAAEDIDLREVELLLD